MYSVMMPYAEIKSIQPALSSFSAKIIEAQLVQEARVAMQESSGLHASMTSKTENGLVEWANLGASLMPMAQATLQKHQPLTFQYMCQIAEPCVDYYPTAQLLSLIHNTQMLNAWQ
jgi:hypothetical protein